jgi:hypothetical protein
MSAVTICVGLGLFLLLVDLVTAPQYEKSSDSR